MIDIKIYILWPDVIVAINVLVIDTVIIIFFELVQQL